MSHYSQGEFDFVKRTKSLLEQYDKIDLSNLEDEKYEITLCVNCLLGLVVLPQQEWTNRIPDINLDEDWFIKKRHITYIVDDQYKIKEIVRHVRNSISHANVSPISKDKGANRKITHLRFKDYNRDDKLTFRAEIPVETLKKFALKFADVMLSIMEKDQYAN